MKFKNLFLLMSMLRFVQCQDSCLVGHNLLGKYDPAAGESRVGHALIDSKTFHLNTAGGFTGVLKLRKSQLQHEHFFQAIRTSGNYQFYFGQYSSDAAFRLEIYDKNNVWCNSDAVGTLVLNQVHEIVFQLVSTTNSMRVVIDGTAYETKCPTDFLWEDLETSGVCLGGRWKTAPSSFTCDATAYGGVTTAHGSTLGAYYYDGVLRMDQTRQILDSILVDAPDSCAACASGSSALVTIPTNNLVVSIDDHVFKTGSAGSSTWNVYSGSSVVNFGEKTWNIFSNGGFTFITKLKIDSSIPFAYTQPRIFVAHDGTSVNPDGICFQLQGTAASPTIYYWFGQGSSFCGYYNIPVATDRFVNLVWRYKVGDDRPTLEIDGVLAGGTLEGACGANFLTSDRTLTNNKLNQNEYSGSDIENFAGEIAAFYGWDRWLDDTEAQTVLDSILVHENDVLRNCSVCLAGEFKDSVDAITYDFSSKNTRASWQAYATEIGGTFSLDSPTDASIALDSIAGLVRHGGVWKDSANVGWVNIPLLNGYDTVTVQFGSAYYQGDVDLCLCSVSGKTCADSECTKVSTASDGEYTVFTAAYSDGQAITIQEGFSIIDRNLVVRMSREGCSQCPANHVSPAGSTSVGDCVCIENFYQSDIDVAVSVTSQFSFSGSLKDYANGQRIEQVAGTEAYVSDATYGDVLDLNQGSFNIVSDLLSDLLNADAWTVSMWFQPTVSAKNSMLFYRLDITGGVLGTAAYMYTDNRVWIDRYTQSSTAKALYSQILTIGTWYHLVFVSTPTKLELYVDNALSTATGSVTTTESWGTVSLTEKKIGIGAKCRDDTDPDCTDHDNHGHLHDMRFYDHALSASEISLIYNEEDETSKACVSCPANHVSPAGSTSVDDCVLQCEANAYKLLKNFARSCGSTQDQSCPATSSSEPYWSEDFAPGKINDGDISTFWHSGGESEPLYLKIDLQRVVNIQYVTITPRQNGHQGRLANLLVRVGDNPDAYDNTVCGDVGSWSDGDTASRNIACVASGRYIFLTDGPADKATNVAQLEAWGSECINCPANHYKSSTILDLHKMCGADGNQNCATSAGSGEGFYTGSSAALLDGVLSGDAHRWHSAKGFGEADSLTIDLGRITNIDSVRVYPVSSAYRSRCKIYVSQEPQGHVITEVNAGELCADLSSLDFFQSVAWETATCLKSGRYVNLIFPANKGDWHEVAEVEVKGEESDCLNCPANHESPAGSTSSAACVQTTSCPHGSTLSATGTFPDSCTCHANFNSDLGPVYDGRPPISAWSYSPLLSDQNCNNPLNFGVHAENYVSEKAACFQTVDSNNYLQLDLSTEVIIIGIQTTGRAENAQYVSLYQLEVSSDGVTWTVVLCSDVDTSNYCIGNTDATSVKQNNLATKVVARHVKLTIKAHSGHESIRMSVLAQTCVRCGNIAWEYYAIE